MEREKHRGTKGEGRKAPSQLDKREFRLGIRLTDLEEGRGKKFARTEGGRFKLPFRFFTVGAFVEIIDH